MPKDIYKKEYTRDFSLAICQVWQYAETEHAKKILPKVFIPHIFEFLGDFVDVWVSANGHKELRQSTVDAVKNDKNFIINLADEYIKDCQMIEQLLAQKISQDNFEIFLNKFIDGWAKLTMIFTIPTYSHRGITKEDKNYSLLARQKTEHIFENGDEIFRNYAREVFPEYKKFEKFFTLDELLNKRIDPESLEKRKQCFVFYERGIIHDKSLDDIGIEHAVRFKKYTISNKKIIRGQVAVKRNKNLTGRVRLILSKKDFYKFKDGDILVAFMTSPYFVPLMKKASAVITDEGGITCHAAIVSREIGVPCIIGTKYATQVLKDGDIVEVDTSRGTVKILG